MSTIVSRLDLTQIIGEVDDFYQVFERYWQQQPMLTATCGERLCRSRLSLSEVITIAVAFHGSGYRTFIDFTPIEVCHPNRSRSHKVFEGLVGWGKNSVGWHYGFKLHLIVNERGELLAFKLTPGNYED